MTKIKKKVGDKDGERSARRGAWGCVGDDLFSHMQTINGGRVYQGDTHTVENREKVVNFKHVFKEMVYSIGTSFKVNLHKGHIEVPE